MDIDSKGAQTHPPRCTSANRIPYIHSVLKHVDDLFRLSKDGTYLKPARALSSIPNPDTYIYPGNYRMRIDRWLEQSIAYGWVEGGGGGDGDGDGGANPIPISSDSFETDCFLAWTELGDWIKDNFDQIICKGNPGSIKFRFREGRPIVIATMENSSDINQEPLLQILARKSQITSTFIVLSHQGKTSRSSGEAHLDIARRHKNGLDTYWEQIPSSGASIGLSSSEAKDTSLTLGGVLWLKLGDKWRPFGMTCHHLLDTLSAVDTWKFEGVEARVQQPAQMHLNTCLENLDPDSSDYKTVLGIVSSNTCAYGKVFCSSGYSLMHHDQDSDVSRNKAHQLDWALIGEIPSERIEDMKLRLDGSRVVNGLWFRRYMDVRNPQFQKPKAQACGIGAISGCKDGFLERTLDYVRFEKNGDTSAEFAFTPRKHCDDKYLGTSGDSGAWLMIHHKSEIHLLGQIIGCSNGTVYYTPMHAILGRIWDVTGAQDMGFSLPSKMDLELNGISFVHQVG